VASGVLDLTESDERHDPIRAMLPLSPPHALQSHASAVGEDDLAVGTVCQRLGLIRKLNRPKLVGQLVSRGTTQNQFDIYLILVPPRPQDYAKNHPNRIKR
jgi:hypothetical protein